MSDKKVFELVLKYDVKDPINKLQSLEKEADEATKLVNKLNKEMRATSDVAQKSNLKKQWQDAKVAADNATKSVEAHRKSTDITSMSYQQLKNYQSQLNKAIATGTRDSKEYVANLKRLGEVEKEISKTVKQANELKKAGEDLAKPTLWNKISTGIKGIGTAFQAIFALQIIGWLVDVGKSIFTTTANFEKYESILTVTTGSQQKAKETMQALRNLAKELPQTTEQLTESYIKLSSRGLRPGADEMRRLTDFSLKSGKSIDELAEAIADINNQERWSEFGVKVSTSGNKIITTIGGVKREFDRTEQGAMDMAVALGSVQGTMGLAEKQMQTLGGAASNVQDGLADLVLLLGAKLKPVFILILSVISQLVNWLIKIVQSSEPVIEVFTDVLSLVGDLVDSFLVFVNSLLPKMSGEMNILQGIFKVFAVVVRATFVPLQILIALLRSGYDAMAGLVNGGKAVMQVLTGDFKGAVQSFESSKKNFSDVKTHAIDSFQKITDGFKKSLADRKTEEVKAAFDTVKNENKKQNELTKEQKKGIEDRKKAQEEALKKIDELENEAAIEHIRRTQGEVAADKAALQQKFELEKAAIEKSLAAQEQKDKQLKLLKAKLDREIEQLETKHQQVVADILEKWVNNEYDTKTKKANDYAKKELEDARKAINDKQKLAEVEKKINDWLKNELAKIEEEKRNKSIEEAEKATKKELEFATKQLNAEKFIMDQKHKAEMALYDGLELAARDNKSKLLQLQKERLDTELRQLKEKLAIEQKAEELKLRQDIKDEAERNAALTKINDAYRAREVEETKKTEQAKAELERKATEEKIRIREGLSSAFGALLKGDFVAFANHLDSVVQREKTAMQQRIDGNMATYQMIAQMAVQAVNFLNDLTQKRIQKDLEALSAEYQQKKAMLEKSLNDERTAVEQAESAVNNLKEQYSDQITKTIDDNENFINQMKQFYNDAQSADSAEKYAEQVNLANSEADEKIRNANRAMEHAQAAARAERDERIVAAEAAKNAEIAAILQRADIDMATKNTLINAATAKANLEIELAKSEADAKIKLSEEEKAAKIKAAQEEKDQKIELLTALKTATKEQADELLKKAKDDAKAKVEAAEKEKIDKLKILEDEKQKRIVAKKELEKKLLEEEKAAKNKEAKLKYDAAMSQWRADQTTALIQGALAAIKAFAVGGPILGFVFAALTAVATGIQIAAIRKNKPQPPAQYATGGMAPLAGIGGLPKGPRHGKKYGDSGLAIVNRQTGVEEGEMEGGEAIISKEQTDANLPIIQQMWSKARKGDRTPVVPMSSRPMAFAYGGIMPSLGGREMFLFGSRKRKAAEAEAAAEAESADTAAAQEAQAKAQENMDKMLETLEAIKEEMTMLNEKTDKLVDGSTQEVSATREVAQAVRDSNANSKLDGVIAAISSWGKK